jgi:phosphoribosyl 1,2-cyclic phosphodiesterase
LEFENGKIVVLDAGTGIRKLGMDLMTPKEGFEKEVIIVLSHTHWDHIQGFPFFAPAFDPSWKVTIAICGLERSGSNLQEIFETQLQRDFFPVPLDMMAGDISFFQPDISSFTGPLGTQVDFYKHNHPGGAYSYRFSEPETGKVLVYSTDIEHGDTLDETHVEFCANADLLIHDGQYSDEELALKKGWGHSSWLQAIEVAKKANVKKLAITHHDPDHDDELLLDVEKQCKKLFANSFLTREGLTVEI